MIKMVKYDEDTYVPEECCTFTNPLTSGGKSEPDDVELPCEGAECCTGECQKCIILKIMNEYAICTGQSEIETKNYNQIVKEVKGTSYITDVPTIEFKTIQELNDFVEIMNKNGIGVTLKAEHSNFYQGILVQIFDTVTCSDSCRKALLEEIK